MRAMLSGEVRRRALQGLRLGGGPKTTEAIQASRAPRGVRQGERRGWLWRVTRRMGVWVGVGVGREPCGPRESNGGDAGFHGVGGSGCVNGDDADGRVGSGKRVRVGSAASTTSESRTTAMGVVEVRAESGMTGGWWVGGGGVSTPRIWRRASSRLNSWGRGFAVGGCV